MLEGKLGSEGVWAQYKYGAEQFLCNFIQQGSSNVQMSPAGMVWWQPWNNFQYTTSALLALVSYSDYLVASKTTLACPWSNVDPEQLISFSRSQVTNDHSNNVINSITIPLTRSKNSSLICSSFN